MDSDEEDAPVIAQKYQKDAKVGEGTYAVVYRGKLYNHNSLITYNIHNYKPRH